MAHAIPYVCSSCPSSQEPTGHVGEFSLEGMFLALDANGDPVLIRIDGEPNALFIPVFTTLVKLRASMRAAGAAWDRVVEIADHESVVTWFRGATAAAANDGEDLRLVVDIRQTAEGITRFQQLVVPPEVQA